MTNLLMCINIEVAKTTVRDRTKADRKCGVKIDAGLEFAQNKAGTEGIFKYEQ